MSRGKSINAYKYLIIGLTFLNLYLLSSQSSFAEYIDWYSNSWSYRRAITIDNSSNPSALTNYQVRIDLSSSNFDFSKAQLSGADLLFTDSDGITVLSHWIESYNSSAQTATIWVKVPSIPASSNKTIYLYYGNSTADTSSNGDNTFEFFDDFESPDVASGYFSLSSPSTVLPQDQGWEVTPPHTLSVVEANMGGYRYWGYYGTAGANEGVGVAFSNDLINWTKYSANPTITNARWPSVLKVGDTFYLTYDKNYLQPGTRYITLATSTDGIHFADAKNLVSSSGIINNNNLFLDPADSTYYLYYRDSSQGYNIQVRHASSVTDLDTAPAQSTGAYGAAPNMIFWNGKYILATEVMSTTGAGGSSWLGIWLSYFYESDSPTSNFSPLANNPIVDDGNACPFQHIFDGTLYLHTCKLTGSTWSMQLRTADTVSGRETVYKPAASKWSSHSITSSSWQVINTTQPDGRKGNVLSGHANNRSILYTNHYSGDDYVVEANGQQIGGRNWAIVSRSDGTVRNMYVAPLYEDIDAGNNQYLSRFASSGNATLGNYAVGAIDKNTWYKQSLASLGSSLKVFYGDALSVSATDTTLASGRPGIYLESAYGVSSTEAVRALLDNFFVRKAVSIEPSISVRNAETMDLTGPDNEDGNTDFELVSISSISGINRDGKLESEDKLKGGTPIARTHKNNPSLKFEKIEDKDSGIDYYQIRLTDTHKGSTRKKGNDYVWIDNIPDGNPSGSNRRDRGGLIIYYEGDKIKLKPNGKEYRLNGGNYYVRIRAYDKAGNHTDSDEVLLMIDDKYASGDSNSYGKPTSLSISNIGTLNYNENYKKYYYTANNFSIKGQVEPTNIKASIDLTIDGQAQPAIETGEGGEFLIPTTLSTGEHTIEVKVAGADLLKEFAITIDPSCQLFPIGICLN